ncbi:hypothetical protein [Hyalangium versicolor]|uniref:hypothetical protein n=1 Tax=Hyalangium versicolor TaxID=2861190 RepID=UPI001CCE9191|nr:hypothetical protein [Hyalangium versicolor]
MSSKSPKVLDSLRVRVRRLQFIVGLGFLSLVIGSVLTGSLIWRVSERVQALPVSSLRVGIALVMENLWVLLVLPLLCYGAARILELKPLSTAVGAALSGELFVLALYFVRDGFEGLWVGWAYTPLRFLVFATGVFLTHRAVVRGRAAAALGATKAQTQAEARKAEYMQFLQDAERGAEKTAQREAERVAAAASTGGAAVAESSPPAVESATASSDASVSPASPSPAATTEAPAEPKAPTSEG